MMWQMWKIFVYACHDVTNVTNICLCISWCDKCDKYLFMHIIMWQTPFMCQIEGGISNLVVPPLLPLSIFISLKYLTWCIVIKNLFEDIIIWGGIKFVGWTVKRLGWRIIPGNSLSLLLFKPKQFWLFKNHNLRSNVPLKIRGFDLILVNFRGTEGL